MIRKIYILLLVIIFNAANYSQWSESGSLPLNFVLNDFHFLSSSQGFATSAVGKIIRTTDAGLTWNLRDDLNMQINTIQFANPGKGWVGGNSGRIYKTVNRGRYWQNQSLISSPANLRDITKIFVLDSLTLWAVGGEYVSRSTDGGSNWNSIQLAASITDVFFTSASNGWASGNDSGIGKIFKTTDGGLTWSEVFSSSFILSQISKIFFINNLEGWFVGARGRVLKTNNGGASWDSLTTNLSQTVNLTSIFFSNSSVGWIGGNEGTLRMTTDGGNTWTSEGDGLTDWTAQKIHFPNLTTGFFSKGNKIFSRKSSMPIRLNSPNGGERLIFSSIFKIKFEVNNVAFVDLHYSTDDGANWNLIQSGYGTQTGFYDWTVPSAQTFLARIKINETSSRNSFVTSEHAFSIVPQMSITVIQPNGGEVYFIDSIYSIKWNHVGIETVNIQLSTDNKNSWQTLASNYPADSLKYIWTVNASQSENSFIRIINFDDSSYVDTSDIAFSIKRQVPVAPQLAHPVNGAKGILAGDKLKWNSRPIILNYHLIFSDDSTFSSSLVNDSTLTDTTFTLPQLSQLRKYFWKVRAKNEGGWSNFSSTFSFNAIGLPAAVQLNSPANNSINLPSEITFNWYHATELTETISKYWFQLTTDTLSNSFAVNDSLLNDTIRTTTNIAYNQEHYWRVAAKNEHGWGSFSSWWKFKTLLPTPGAVTPIAPANNAVNLNLPIQIIWSSIIFAQKYHLDVATDSSFTNIVFSDTALADTSQNFNNLTNNTTYYWRARAWNTSGFGPFLQVQKFHVIPAMPPVPNLISPNNNVVGMLPPLVFNWNASSTATMYQFVISSDSSFTNIGFTDSTLTDTTISLSQLNSLTKYFWKVRGKNVAGWGNYSSVFSFTTLGTPTIPQPVFPANNALDIPINLQFKWTKAADRFNETVTKYWYQLRRDTNTVTSVREDSTLVDTFYNVQSLENNKEHYWRVAAKNQAGWGNFSNWSKFKTIVQAPAQVNLSSPANNAVNQPVALTLRWFGISIAESYRLEVSTDQSFNSYILIDSTLTDTFKVISNLQLNGLYYWRVRAKNVGGIGDWSDVWNFSTTLPKATLASPDSGSIGNELTIMFLWNQTTGASKYHIQIATAPNFLALIAEDSNVTSLQKQFSDLPAFTDLYWRVRAGNAGGYGAFSNVWTFKTKGNPFQVQLLSPVDSSIHQPINLNFVWSKPGEITASLLGKEIGTIEGVNKYWLEINYDTSNVAIFVDSTITDTTSLVSNLQHLTKHFWRVKGKNEAGWGAFSNWFNFTTVIQEPDTIILASPENNAVNQQIDISLNWFSEARSDRYEVEVAEDSLFTTIVYNDTSITDTSTTVNGLDYLTNYFWRVRGKNIGGLGFYSVARKFTTIIERPETPMLSSPDSGITALVPPIILKWHSSLRTEKYELELSKFADFSTLAFADSNIVDTLKQLPSVDYLTTYYWRVRAANIGGVSDNSTVYQFKTVGLPSTINHIYPTANAVNIPINLTFKWTRSFDQTDTISFYHLQLTKDTTSNIFTMNDSTLTDTFAVATNLENYVYYYWRVRAINEFGWNSFTQWKRFRTIIQAPPAIVLSSPANGAVNLQTSLVFFWHREPISTKYHFELSTDSLFTTFTFRDTAIVDTFRGLPLLLTNNSKYFWRVRGTNIGGYGAYSQVFNFSTVVSAPAPPILTSPTNGAISIPINLTLKWDTTLHSDIYYYQLAKDAGFTQLILSDSTISTSQSVIGLNYKTRYYWRVRARNISGFGSWSNIFNFLTIKRPVLAPTNLVAFNSGVMRVSLTWEDNSNNERNFVVQRKFGDSSSTEPFAEIAVLDSNSTTYVDSIFLVWGTYTYRVYASSEDTISAYSNLSQLQIISSVADVLPGIPENYELKNNFPNPFNPSTNIRFGLPAKSNVRLVVYNSVGEIVEELMDEELPAGNYNLKFVAEGIPSGVYFYRITASEISGSRNFNEVRKMLILK